MLPSISSSISPSSASQKQGIAWNGSFFVHHSLALVNRELTLALLQNSAFADRFNLSLEPYESSTFDPGIDPRFQPLVDRQGSPLDALCLTVRHRWPPDFRPPTRGQYVLIQPWEFGALPNAWVEGVAHSVDEVWAYSHFVRETYLRAGVPEEKVAVVPLGVNTARFHPAVAPYNFAANPQTAHLTSDTYKFLFVGGTIARKGIDVLLEAYDRAFTSKDDVTLIVKDFGTESFYANQGAGALIRTLQAKSNAPNIVYIADDLSETEIAALYAACDCLVHPYRGEGYGLPIAEAMACGKPTLVTGSGAALDFANETNAYLIPSRLQRLPEKRIGDMETVDYPFLAEPDRDALITLLQRVAQNREEAAAKGAKAAEDITTRHTWEEAARIAAERLIVLADRAEQSADAPAFILPLGLGGLKLGGFGGASALGNTPGIRALGTLYEDRKQAALQETRHGDWQNALADLEACLIERPDDWDLVNALAVARFRVGEVEKAIPLLRRGIASAPNARDFHHNLAFALLANDNPLEALENALLALQFTPDHAELCRTVERCGDAVLKMARKVLRRYPNKQRDKAKRDPEYRALMERYRQAQAALHQPLQSGADPGTEPIASTRSKTQNPKSGGRHRLSLCMIVKNEERFLRNCLESVRDVVDEIVIVDTGSTDDTLAIAREYGAIIAHHTWTDDFSAARNVSLAHATGDWALWLDADEEIAPDAGTMFRTAIDNAPADIGGYMVMFRNWLQSTTRKEGSEMAVHHACRLFRLVDGVRFLGRVHEQNLRSLQDMGYKYAHFQGLIIDHFGYANEIMTLRNKHARFIRMLTREVEENPLPEFRNFHLFNLGNAYFTFGDMENAAIYLGLAAEEPDLREEYTVTCFVELATALHRLGRSDEGLQVCERADALGLAQAGIEFARGYCLLHQERYEEAEMAFRSALESGEADSSLFAKTGDAGVGGFKSRYGLALALVGQDRYEEAWLVCEQTLMEQPGMIEAYYLQSVVLTRLDRTAEACHALEALLARQPTHEDALRDLGMLSFAGKDYASALPYVRHTAQHEPTNYDAQARLAICCEHLGLLEEARAAYERLRALAPDSSEVCVNLGRLLASLGADAEAIDCFTDAIALDPGDGNAYFNAGDVLYRLGYYSRAAETYIAGLEQQPEHTAGFFVLGNCYFRTRDYAAAILSYQQALAQDPSHDEARHNLALAEEMASQEQAA